MKFPISIEEKLGRGSLAARTHDVAERFLNWMGDTTKGLSFFVEYTDHGPDHIRAVLDSAAALIEPASLPFLTSEDAAVLVLATLLHDSAMHLTTDGLLSLVAPDRRVLVPELDRCPWWVLFDEYYSESRRWDDRKLFRVLGDQSRRIGDENLRNEVCHLENRPNSEEWTPRYRKYLGEFVRRHHARLAHEVALIGFPGARQPTGLSLEPIDADLRDISGFVARSHNMALRDTVEYLSLRYEDAVRCHRTHPVFLAGLLRIADFLELRSDRVNPVSLEVQRLRSPVSQAEWSAHLAIKDVKPHVRDSESILVVAAPRSAGEFLKIQTTLSTLQAELDSTWAVFGEVYSRQHDLRALGMTLRRVRSNLDDSAAFFRKTRPSYFPVLARFDAAGASLIKLLVRPLYGDWPVVGVRELLQNALDAVHEARQYRADHPETQVEFRKQDNDVLICVERQRDGSSVLTISDKGIGMSAEIVRDYFLKAGASFRQSDEWWKAFGTDRGSKVLRSGRFGIGALATFLLGSRVEVWTRRIDCDPDDGVYFNAAIEDDAIELVRISREEIGTTIRVSLSERARESLMVESRWDWYALSNPSVGRVHYGKQLHQASAFPHLSESLDTSDWRSVDHPEYDCIHWCYENETRRIYCNGLAVRDEFASAEFFWSDERIPLKTPSLSIFDSKGVLPLTVPRYALESGVVPFEDALLADITKDLCAFLLVHGPEGPDELLRDYVIPYWGLRLWATEEGVGLFHPWHSWQSGIDRFYSVISGSASFRPNSVFTGVLPYPRMFRLESPLSTTASISQVLTTESNWLGRTEVAARLLATSNPLWDDVYRDSRAVRIAYEGGDGPLFEAKALSEGRRAFADLFEKLKKAAPGGKFALVEYSVRLSETDVEPEESAFVRVWREVMGSSIVPFDRDERRRRFSNAYSKLAKYVAAWEGEPVGWRRQLLRELGRRAPDRWEDGKR